MSNQNGDKNGEKNGDKRGTSGTPLFLQLNDPFAMFAYCHQRIRKQCANLEALAQDFTRHHVDDTARKRASMIVRFFDVDAFEHHEDEDLVFFPKLLELNINAAEKSDLVALLDILSKDHKILSAAWDRLRDALLKIVEGKSDWASVDVITFVALHQHHMHSEDSSVFPFARRYIRGEMLQELHRAIVARHVRH